MDCDGLGWEGLRMKGERTPVSAQPGEVLLDDEEEEDGWMDEGGRSTYLRGWNHKSYPEELITKAPYREYTGGLPPRCPYERTRRPDPSPPLPPLPVLRTHDGCGYYCTSRYRFYLMLHQFGMNMWGVGSLLFHRIFAFPFFHTISSCPGAISSVLRANSHVRHRTTGRNSLLSSWPTAALSIDCSCVFTLRSEARHPSRHEKYHTYNFQKHHCKSII